MQKYYDDLHADVADAITAARDVFYAAVRDAASTGFPVGRTIGLIGFANARYILGPEATEPWKFERGYTAPARRPLAPEPGPTPAMMPRRTA